ncbi:MAG: 5-formyltetrahydrofolate cyclo-ligase [Clostridium sp.]
MDKKQIRNEVIKNRDLLSLEFRKEKDKLILESLLESELYKNSVKIFTFINYGSEVETKEFINRALKDGKRVFLPKTIKSTKEMKAVEISSLQNLKPDKWEILEPCDFEGEINKNLLDLIIVPGVVFDKKGNRIGYGGGYYDRYLSNISLEIKKIALAYELQLVEYIESENHDIAVDYIVTENKIRHLEIN